MAKSFAGLKADALVIKNEVEESKNTAARIGTMFSDVVEKMENVESETIKQANTQFVGNIVNNLTDGGADKALSAEMGKELGKHTSSKFTSVEIDSRLEDVKEKSLSTHRSLNLFNPLEIIEGQGISNDGIIFDTEIYSGWATSGYIEVLPDTDYHLSIQGEKARTITYCLFDADKQPISSFHNAQLFSTSIHTTPDTKYIMFNVKAYGKYNTKIMLTEGLELQDFVPYNTITTTDVLGLDEELDKFHIAEHQLAPVVVLKFTDVDMWDVGYYYNRGLLEINRFCLIYKDKIAIYPNQKINIAVNTYSGLLYIVMYDVQGKYMGTFTVTTYTTTDYLLERFPDLLYIRVGINLVDKISDSVTASIVTTDFIIDPIKTTALIGNIAQNVDRLLADININRELATDITPFFTDNSKEVERTLISDTVYGWYSNDGITVISSGATSYKGYTTNVQGYKVVSITGYDVFDNGRLKYALLDSNLNVISTTVVDPGYVAEKTVVTLPYNAAYIRFNARANHTPLVVGYRKAIYIGNENIKDGSIQPEKLAFSIASSSPKEITISNSDKIGIIGDSYTESGYAIKGKSYISKLSLFSDFQFVNFGKSGDIYAGRIADIRNKVPLFGNIPYDVLKPKYSMMCCYTNDTKYMSNSQYLDSLDNAVKAVMGIGSIPIVCTEYHTGGSGADIQQIRTGLKYIADKYRLQYWDIAQMVDILKGSNYTPFWGGSHMGTRTNALESDNYEKYLKGIESPMQSIKIFRARENYDNYDNYMFVNNEERAQLFMEINVGALDLKDSSNVDTIPGSSLQSNPSEYQTLMSGNSITMEKVSLISAVLPAFSSDIRKLILKIDCSSAKVFVKNSMAAPYPSVEKLSSFYVIPTVEPSVGDKYLCSEDNKEYTVVSHIVDEAGDYHLLCTPFVSSGFATVGTLTRVIGSGDSSLSYNFREMGINPSGITTDTIGHWVELEAGVTGNYDVSGLVSHCVDVDKCHFLIVSESNSLTLNNVSMEIEYGKEKNVYRIPPYEFITTYYSDSEELLPASTFGTVGASDPIWRLIPYRIYEDINGTKSYPTGCSSVVKITDVDRLECTINGEKLRTGWAKCEVWCRYFPAIYTDGSGNQITDKSYDYNSLVVEVGNTGQTFRERVNTYWKIVQFDVYTVANKSLYMRFSSDERGLEVARVSLKYL